MGGKLGIPLEKEDILERDKNLALQKVAYGHLKELFHGLSVNVQRA